jgi:hypothetical protein
MHRKEDLYLAIPALTGVQICSLALHQYPRASGFRLQIRILRLESDSNSPERALTEGKRLESPI